MQPAPTVEPAPLEAPDDELFEATIVIARGASVTPWSLIDIDGTAFPLDRTNVLGRRPVAADAPEGAQLIALSDPSRVLSRRHMLIEVEDDRVWATDLESTNGSEALDALGAATQCAPGERREIPHDGALSLGGRVVSFQPPER